MEATLDESQLAHLIIEKLEAHQAVDITLLDLRELTPIVDFFVICTAESDRQSRMLLEIVQTDLKQDHKIMPLSAEGETASGWLLLDYNAVVVHIFSPQARMFYRLEELWKAAPVVLKIQ